MIHDEDTDTVETKLCQIESLIAQMSKGWPEVGKSGGPDISVIDDICYDHLSVGRSGLGITKPRDGCGADGVAGTTGMIDIAGEAQSSPALTINMEAK
jgi:hypothetical protein